MIRPAMARAFKPLLVSAALLTLAALLGACGSYGTENIKVPEAQSAMHHGALLFNQRCSGCHTLSYAAAHGSASNVRTAQYNNGPSFDQRCERPVTRVLYAIENGGFSGAIMPQNIVIGQDAKDVAMFVATYGGRKAPQVPGVVPCLQEPVGTVPAVSASGTTGPGTAAALAQAKKANTVAKKSAGKEHRTKRKGRFNGTPASTGQGQGKGAQ